MAKNVFREMLKPQAHLNRNGFDRSYLNNFTAKIGELLPVMCCETVPGSHYEINVSDMMRTIPMNNAAFIRASQHFEFYFVPYRQLWHRWDDFYTKRSMPLSAGVDFDVPAAAPNASVSDIINSVYECSHTVAVGGEQVITTKQVGDIGEAIGEGCKKIYNLLGYGSLQPYVSAERGVAAKPNFFDTLKINLFRAAAYQKIFFDYYRQPFYDLPFNGIQYAFNLDDANLSTGQVSMTLSGKDDRAYYRGARLFQLHYRQWKKDLFTGVLPDTQFGAISVVNLASSSGSVAIAAQTITSGSLSATGYAYGAGAAIMSTVEDGLPASGPIESDGTGGFVDSADNPLKIGNRTLSGSSQLLSTINSVPVTGTIPEHSGTFTSTGTFNVLQLVYAQALQRWREITMRSGFRATEQYQGHFGVKPIFSEKDRCVFIDSVSSPLQVNTVTNTNAGAADSEGSSIPLGDLGANGTAVIGGNKTIKFDAKDFGVLMCIYSMLPEATYQAQGVDIMNSKILPDDFFVPEFENIGLQLVPMSAFKLPKGNSQDGNLPLLANGYAARYFEYKVGIDRQCDEFRGPEDGYVNSFDDPVTIESGSFFGWSPSREISMDPDYSGVSAPALFARDLYVNPRYFRHIFSRLPYLGASAEYPYSPQLTIGSSKYDSFVHQCYFDIKCIQPMSVLGLPRY